MKPRLNAFSLAFVLLWVIVFTASYAAAHNNLTNLFRFKSQDAVLLSTNKSYDTLEPYVAFKFIIVQTAGPKHANKEPLQCHPERGDTGMSLVCEDGSQFDVIGVSFPQEGEQK